MIHAYSKYYVDDAQKHLGVMLDYMVNHLGHDIEDAFEWFVGTGVGVLFGTGDSNFISGMSGTELARHVMDEASVSYPDERPELASDHSAEYWTGWMTAYYQWYRNTDFEDIQEAVGISNIRDMYRVYHEMDISKAVEHIDRLRESENDNNLRRLRVNAGLTQKELADLSEIPVRTIQQYEQGQKNINKAQAEYVIRMAMILKCRPEELLEAV